VKPELKKIPGVDTLMKNQIIESSIEKYGEELVKFAIRNTLDEIRSNVKKGNSPPTQKQIVHR